MSDELLEWVRPSGTTVKTNGRKETIEACVKLGWLPAKEAPKKKPAPKKKADK